MGTDDVGHASACPANSGELRSPGQAEACPTSDPALVLAPEAPYPLVGGGALRTASLIQYLARTRPVDLILFRQPGAPDPASHLPAGLIRRASVIQLPPTGRGQMARAMRNSSRVIRRVPPLVDRFAGFEREVANAIGAALGAISTRSIPLARAKVRASPRVRTPSCLPSGPITRTSRARIFPLTLTNGAEGEELREEKGRLKTPSWVGSYSCRFCLNHTKT